MALPTTSREHSNNLTKLSMSSSFCEPLIAKSSSVSVGNDDDEECAGAAETILKDID